jgi:CHAT domain-containing protein/tetratricopeptide (TPR) repeat protein
MGYEEASHLPIVDLMSVSTSEYREGFCPDCGHEDITQTWLVIDLAERPELREELRDAGAYRHTCPRCQHVRWREMPLLVLNLADSAPIALACPDEMLALDDPAASSSGLVERTRRVLDAEHRSLPGPLLPIPFDVLAVAVGRDIERDVADPDAAVREVMHDCGVDAAQQHAIFIGNVAGSLPLRRLEAALQVFWSVRSVADLERATKEHPELLCEGARERIRSIVRQAGEADDSLGVRIARAQLALLERCAQGEVTEGWDEYAAEGAYAEDVDPRLEDLWRRFREARDGDPGLAAAIGEDLVATSAKFHVVQSEAPAAFETASAYWNRAEGDRAAHVERACELLERSLELCEREPDLVDPGLRSNVLLNLSSAVAARGRGDPAANQERALALQREALVSISRDADGRRWAMVQTNLGLSLLERAGVLDQRLQNQQETGLLAQEMITEAIDHFEAALTWRSFERDPEDWAYTQINLALAYSRDAGGDRRDELRRAIEHYSEAIRGFAASGAVSHLAQAFANRATARADLAAMEGSDSAERKELLESAEADARDGISAVGENARGVDAGRRWWQLGRVLSARYGYAPETLAALERSLEDLTPTTSPRDCRQTARHLADLAIAAGDWEVAAQAWYQAAEAGLAAVEERATLAGRRSEVAANGNLVRWAAYALVRIGSYHEAIELLERGRGLQLATWLRGDVVDLAPVRRAAPTLCSRFIDLRRRVELGERNDSAVEDAGFPLAVEELKATITEIRSLPGLDRFLTRPSLTELVATLGTEETIAYPLTSPWGSAWLLASRTVDNKLDVDVVDLPVLTSTIAFEALVRFDPATDLPAGYLIEQSRQSRGDNVGQELTNVSKVLGQGLMMPLAEALKQTDRHAVCLVPTGLLALVPLHALTWQSDRGDRCLLDELDVTFSPSAYIRDISRSRAEGHRGFERLVAVGNPLPQIRPLQHSEAEAEAVAATVPAAEHLLLTREAASKEAVLAALPSASHVHLACHGSAAEDPLGFDAALWFAHDVPISAAEILDLDLSGTRLVVASACETGVVAGYDTLDEALALSTIFLVAGAAGAIASLWKVNDYATRLLMTRFYEELVASPDRADRALREAQLWLRDLTPDEVARYTRSRPHLHADRKRTARAEAAGRPAGKDFSDPAMWAAFTLNGA